MEPASNGWPRPEPNPERGEHGRSGVGGRGGGGGYYDADPVPQQGNAYAVPNDGVDGERPRTRAPTYAQIEEERARAATYAEISERARCELPGTGVAAPNVCGRLNSSVRGTPSPYVS